MFSLYSVIQSDMIMTKCIIFGILTLLTAQLQHRYIHVWYIHACLQIHICIHTDTYLHFTGIIVYIHMYTHIHKHLHIHTYTPISSESATGNSTLLLLSLRVRALANTKLKASNDYLCAASCLCQHTSARDHQTIWLVYVSIFVSDRADSCRKIKEANNLMYLWMS